LVSLGLITTGLHHFLLFWYPGHFIAAEAARVGYLDSWFSIVSTIGLGVRFIVIPLLAAIGGFSLVHFCKEPIQRVAGWFLVAGTIFGLGILVLDWTVAEPSYRMSLDVALQYGALMMSSVSLPAVIGVTIGHFSDGNTRSLPPKSI
jgi:hypothetical protein